MLVAESRGLFHIVLVTSLHTDGALGAKKTLHVSTDNFFPSQTPVEARALRQTFEDALSNHQQKPRRQTATLPKKTPSYSLF
jgi:hypothetical protein